MAAAKRKRARRAIERILDGAPEGQVHRDPSFRRRIRSNPSAWNILVDILLEDIDRGEKAAEALVWADGPVAELLADHTKKTWPVWKRVRLLDLIWVITRTTNCDRRATTISMLMGIIDDVFDDVRINKHEVDPRVEIEYVYRVCDHTYAIFTSLLNPEFDEDEFRSADDRERDRMIRSLRSPSIPIS